MRPVKAERKPRGRAKPNRRGPPAGGRVPPERMAFGRKKPPRNDPFSRAWRGLKEKLNRGRPMLILTLVLIGATVVGAPIAGGQAARTVRAGGDAVHAAIADAGFGIEAVKLSGERRTPPNQILAALGFKADDSIFAVNVHAARARLMMLPWVADAEVRRIFPDTIAVSIVEKLPFALWRADDGKVYVVERSGNIVTGADPARFVKLHFLIGKGAPAAAADLIDAIATHRAVLARTRAVERVSERRWNLLFNDDVVVKLPETGWQEQLDVLEKLIVDGAVLEHDIAEIDLRSPDHFTFILRTGEQKKVPREKAA